MISAFPCGRVTLPEMRLNTPVKSLFLFAGALGACLGLLALRFLFTGHFSYLFLVGIFFSV